MQRQRQRRQPVGFFPARISQASSVRGQQGRDDRVNVCTAGGRGKPLIRADDVVARLGIGQILGSGDLIESTAWRDGGEEGEEEEEGGGPDVIDLGRIYLLGSDLWVGFGRCKCWELDSLHTWRARSLSVSLPLSLAHSLTRTHKI